MCFAFLLYFIFMGTVSFCQFLCFKSACLKYALGGGVKHFELNIYSELKHKENSNYGQLKQENTITAVISLAEMTHKNTDN